MKVEITISLKKDTHYELGDVFYNPKGRYKFVLVGTTMRQRIKSQMWYGARDSFSSITIVPERVLRECQYLGKSKGFDELFEIEGLK